MAVCLVGFGSLFVILVLRNDIGSIVYVPEVT